MNTLFTSDRKLTEFEIVARVLWASEHPFVRYHEVKQSEREPYELKAKRIIRHVLEHERVY